MQQEKYRFYHIYKNLNYQTGPYILCQTGDLYFHPGCASEAERLHQKSCGIVYVALGRGTSEINHKTFPLSADMLHLFSPERKLCIKSSKESPLRVFFLEFTFSDTDCLPYISILKNFFKNPPDEPAENAFILQDIFINMFSQLMDRDAFSNILLESAVNQLLCSSCRLFSKASPSKDIAAQNPVSRENLACDIARFLETHVGSLSSLTEISKEFGYSYSCLAQKFTESMGMSPKEYYEFCRFQKAKEYLTEGMQVTAVAELIGFQSIHAFSNAFKKEFGLSPSVFQRQYLQNSKEKGY